MALIYPAPRARSRIPNTAKRYPEVTRQNPLPSGVHPRGLKVKGGSLKGWRVNGVPW